MKTFTLKYILNDCFDKLFSCFKETFVENNKNKSLK